MVYAVIDTNVIVSSLITKNAASPVILVMQAIFSGKVRLLFNNAILSEYKTVLSRPKFELNQDTIDSTLSELQKFGINVDAPASGADLPDPKDIVFYDVAIAYSDKNASLVTSNLKHFPGCACAVTPREFLEILATRETQILNDIRAVYRANM